MSETEENVVADIPGLRKAAIFIVTLGATEAARVMKHLDREMVEDISREIAALEGISLEERERVVSEFYNLVMANASVERGGLAFARTMLEGSVGKEEAERLMSQIEHSIHMEPFSFLGKTESENLLTFIQDEHPQTIALILAHLVPSKASEVLVGLTASKQMEVVGRIANMEQTSPEVIKEVEVGLEKRLSGLMGTRLARVGGVDHVAEMLNLADRSTEKSILEAIEAEDPDLVEQIRRLMFVFEDILLVNDKGIQAFLKEIDNEDLTLALKTASDELKEKIFSNMSDRAQQMIQEDMEYMGPVRLSDVESAQQKIVDVVRRLEDAGEIIIAGRGGEKELIV